MKATVNLEFQVDVEIDEGFLKDIVLAYRGIVNSDADLNEVISEIARQRILDAFSCKLFVEGVGYDGEYFKVTEDTDPVISVDYEEEPSDDYKEWESENCK